ncbi:MAG: hypothetical protein P9L91_02175 [Candidatus Zophobacter franzmannii]|jgi:Ni2+-binding GTPase involved in maturation of urease and hydrogenase|nr:hypothetical protein [Candidatus Zophobacter franzmannii]
MKSIIEVSEEGSGKEYIVIHKIRHILNQFGTIVITFDNGDVKSLSPDNPEEMLGQILEQIETYYG